MKEIRVLIIEDEKSISKFIRINLERAGFKVYAAYTGEDGLSLYKEVKPDVIIQDIMLPGMTGLEVCEEIREENPSVIIIMLTAKGQDMDKIMGLELGADDYMVKPFNPLELVARIRAQLRKNDLMVDQQAANVNAQSGIIHNKKHKKIYKDGEPIQLSPREYDLLALFLETPYQTFNRNELLDAVWGRDYYGDVKTVDVHIRRIRAKVETDASNPEYIETVWGRGYRYNGDVS